MKINSYLHPGLTPEWDIDYYSIEETIKDPKRKKNIELEMKKLEMSLAIINLRKKKKISQAKLAEKIGMKQSAVGRIEAGKQNLTIETLQKIAVALNKELVVGFR